MQCLMICSWYKMQSKTFYICCWHAGYSEVVNMDPSVMAMLQKSISAKLCPTVIGKRRDFFYLRCSVVDLSLDPDPESFVPDPDPARMKEQIN